MIKTFEEAALILPALRFDLGQSTSVIKEMFNDGFVLEYNDYINGYVWIRNNQK